MLAATHFVSGAVLAGIGGRPSQRAAAALGAHVLLDFVGHDDRAVGPVFQAVLGMGAAGIVAAAWGFRSPQVVTGLIASAPDLEVAVGLVVGVHRGPLVFPSHWQLRPDQDGHPYRLPRTAVPFSIECAVTAAVTAALVAAGVMRRRRPAPA